ncbi:hypothetical protein Bbelb_389240 [Branchiostoma belcheri]|nr:hypothetical protein Bbelb_389240 [Branchiostoma belcheri]
MERSRLLRRGDTHAQLRQLALIANESFIIAEVGCNDTVKPSLIKELVREILAHSRSQEGAGPLSSTKGIHGAASWVKRHVFRQPLAMGCGWYMYEPKFFQREKRRQRRRKQATFSQQFLYNKRTGFQTAQRRDSSYISCAIDCGGLNVVLMKTNTAS